ncbi:MAG: glycosyltransferase [Candidatus Omnitrophica bacterium]|nr:glycosyltransferase [Candidatus Omnitrophota bacterium]
MIILHIINNLDYGGAERLLLQMARAQIQRGHKVKIICVAPVGAMADQAARMNVPVLSLNGAAGFSIVNVLRLASIIHHEKTNVVHNHNPRAQIHGTLAARLAGVKNITTRHGNERKSIPSFIWMLTDMVVFISRATQAAFLVTEHVKRGRSTVVHNGIDLTAFNYGDTYHELRGHVPNSKSELGTCPLNSCRIGIVARLAPEKDIGTLIKAFQILVQQVPQAELVIAGDGGERSKLVALAQNDQRIKFLGSRDDIPELMHSFDIFVLASLTEGISLTLLEAMAASKPVVATRVGGNPEVVVDGETGYLVPAQDPQAMADKILLLLNDRDLAVKMGKAGRASAERFFSIGSMTDKYERVYQDVVDRV